MYPTENPPSTQGTHVRTEYRRDSSSRIVREVVQAVDYQERFFAHQMYQNPVHFHVEKKRTHQQTNRQTDRQTDIQISSGGTGYCLRYAPEIDR